MHNMTKLAFKSNNAHLGLASTYFTGLKTGFCDPQNQFSKNDFWFKRDKIN